MTDLEISEKCRISHLFTRLFPDFFEKEEVEDYTIFEYTRDNEEETIVVTVFVTTSGKSYEFPVSGKSFELEVSCVFTIYIFLDVDQ